MNLFRTKRKVDTVQGKRIGVVGLSARCGVTHIAIALANYLSDRHGKSVCLIEKSGHSDLHYICQRKREGQDSELFELHNVTYLCHGCEEAYERMLDSSFDCMVYDLGSNLKAAIPELCRCDIRIVVGAAAPWRGSEYEGLKLLSEGKGRLMNWKLLVNLGNPDNIRDYGSLGLEAGCFPFESEPLFPGNETFTIFDAVLN